MQRAFLIRLTSLLLQHSALICTLDKKKNNKWKKNGVREGDN